MAKLRNYLRTLIRKWLDKMQYRIEHEMDDADYSDIIEEFDKLNKTK